MIFEILRQKHSLNWMTLKSLLISVQSSMTSLQNVTKAWSGKLIRFATKIRSLRVS